MVTKKLWNKAKVVLYMVRKTLAKTKLQVDLHVKLKNGKLAWKALTTPLHHHRYFNFACHSTCNNFDALFISPQGHAVRGSNTPLYGSKQNSQHHPNDGDNIERVVFEVSNDCDASIEQSPSMLSSLVSHKLRVVDSPLKVEEESQVDMAAEEFINKFYIQLKQQRITSIESPSPDHLRSH
ncbi:hypothetical protein L1887_17707 [Cichorium endivia]|nr:hypothetical protein L1887_17707 [Cichorium endivia]